MSKDIVPEIQEKIEKEFLKLAEKSQTLKRTIKALAEKKATHLDSNEFAIEVGKMLSETFGHQITSDVLPDGKMYYNIAKRLLETNLKHNYDLVGDYSKRVQKALNEKAGLSIKAIKPEVNQSRIDGLVKKITGYENFEDGKWLLHEPVINFTQAVVDDTIKQNAEFQYKAGLRPKIVRRESGHCCPWCKNKSGEYEYPGAPDYVYHRHQYCRCTVDYLPGDGKKQDVWSKKWSDAEKEGKIKDRKTLRLPFNLQLFSNTDVSKQTDRQLRKGIDSYNKQIELHKNKIRHPERYDAFWNNKSEEHKSGLIMHWKKEIKVFEKNLNDNMEELKRRKNDKE